MSIEENLKLIEIKNIHKQFPGVYALNDVSITAYPGEVLGLVGVNGAGKSTLMNILGGILRPDSGHILIDGKPVEINSPRDSEKNSIAFIQQEIQFFFNMTVYENVFLMNLQDYRKYKYLPLLDKKELCKKTNEYLNMLGCKVDPNLKVGALHIGEQQMVQIARALAQGGKILLFDEPTSSLSLKEKEKLFEVIKNLKEKGDTIIFISHYLDEVQNICDRVVVMCDGKVSGEGLISDMSKERITSYMIPKEIKFKGVKSKVSEEVVLEVENLSGFKKPKNVTFKLHKGEVLGLWGLLGSGRTETIRTILGFDEAISGKVFFKEGNTLKEIKRKNLLKACGYITEDRHFNGLFLAMEIWKNITSSNLKKFASKFLSVLNTKQEKEEGLIYVKRLKVAASSQFSLTGQLSGGNQQKVVIGKWLSKETNILLLDEPTKGVDVGAKIEIQNLIRKLASDGTSCIVVSSEVEEIQHLCDNVIVMNEGNVVAYLSAEEMTTQRLIKECLGKG